MVMEDIEWGQQTKANKLLKALPIQVYIIYGYFQSKPMELSSCNRCRMAGKAKNIYCLSLYRRSLPTPGLE